jgi:hypothetical protein
VHTGVLFGNAEGKQPTGRPTPRRKYIEMAPKKYDRVRTGFIYVRTVVSGGLL